MASNAANSEERIVKALKWLLEATNNQARKLIVREAMTELANMIIANVPPCPARTEVLREVRKAWIYCNWAFYEDPPDSFKRKYWPKYSRLNKREVAA